MQYYKTVYIMQYYVTVMQYYKTVYIMQYYVTVMQYYKTVYIMQYYVTVMQYYNIWYSYISISNLNIVESCVVFMSTLLTSQLQDPPSGPH